MRLTKEREAQLRHDAEHWTGSAGNDRRELLAEIDALRAELAQAREQERAAAETDFVAHFRREAERDRAEAAKYTNEVAQAIWLVSADQFDSVVADVVSGNYRKGPSND